jgi:hypothetical protein
MSQSIHRDQMPELLATEPPWNTYEPLRYVYGAKPSHSLVSALGVCVSGAADEIFTGPCDGSSRAAWIGDRGQLRLEGTERCLHLGEAGGFELADCAPSGTSVAAPDTWQVLRSKWRNVYTGECIAVRDTQNTTESPLVLEACSGFSAPSQSFELERLETGQMRIRHVGSGLCVHAPALAALPDSPPLLAPCGADRDSFEGSALSEIGLDGYCLDRASSNQIRFVACSGQLTQSFFFSGPIEGANGQMLTLSASAAGSPFIADALALDPSPNQIFDYYL